MIQRHNKLYKAFNSLLFFQRISWNLNAVIAVSIREI